MSFDDKETLVVDRGLDGPGGVRFIVSPSLAARTTSGKERGVRYVAGFISLVCAALTAASLVPGCSNSSEGQPCSTLGSNMGDDDCQSGLTCTKASELNGGGYTKDVCCPTDRTQATTTICQLPSNPIAEAGAFPDVAAPVDAGMEAESTDAPAGDGATMDTSVADGPTDAQGDTRGSPADARTEGG